MSCGGIGVASAGDTISLVRASGRRNCLSRKRIARPSDYTGVCQRNGLSGCSVVSCRANIGGYAYRCACYGASRECDVNRWPGISRGSDTSGVCLGLGLAHRGACPRASRAGAAASCRALDLPLRSLWRGLESRPFSFFFFPSESV